MNALWQTVSISIFFLFGATLCRGEDEGTVTKDESPSLQYSRPSSLSISGTHTKNESNTGQSALKIGIDESLQARGSYSQTFRTGEEDLWRTEFGFDNKFSKKTNAALSVAFEKVESHFFLSAILSQLKQQLVPNLISRWSLAVKRYNDRSLNEQAAEFQSGLSLNWEFVENWNIDVSMRGSLFRDSSAILDILQPTKISSSFGLSREWDSFSLGADTSWTAYRKKLKKNAWVGSLLVDMDINDRFSLGLEANTLPGFAGHLTLNWD